MILDLLKLAILVALWLLYWIATPGDAEGAELVSRETRDVLSQIIIFLAGLVVVAIMASVKLRGE